MDEKRRDDGVDGSYLWFSQYSREQDATGTYSASALELSSRPETAPYSPVAAVSSKKRSMDETIQDRAGTSRAS